MDPHERSLSDSLHVDTNTADYQMKMAKAMRVRSERHDQALAAQKADYDARVASLTEQFAAQAEDEARRHEAEVRRLLDDARAREKAAVEQVRRSYGAALEASEFELEQPEFIRVPPKQRTAQLSSKDEGTEPFLSHRPMSGNKFVSDGIAIITQAIKLDEDQKYEEAYPRYKKGLDCLMAGIKKETNASVRDIILKRATSYMDRAEALKKVLDEQQKSRSTAPPKGGGGGGAAAATSATLNTPLNAPHSQRLDMAELVDDIDSLGIKALRELIASRGGSFADCIEKGELRKRAREVLARHSLTTPSSSISSKKGAIEQDTLVGHIVDSLDELEGKLTDALELVRKTKELCPPCPSWGGFARLSGISFVELAEDFTRVFVRAPNRLTPFEITTLHICCSSDKFIPGRDFAGFIIYGVDDDTQEEPYEIGGRRVKPGYIVIRDTSSPEFTAAVSTEGKVHGKVFVSVFGNSKTITESKIIGEGFAIQDGVLKTNSYTFNVGTPYHDNDKAMSAETTRLLRLVIAVWMSGGAHGCQQNFSVQELSDPGGKRRLKANLQKTCKILGASSECIRSSIAKADTWISGVDP